MVIGYTTGVFDLFHIGHLSLLRNAKSMCDTLVVGVTTDDLVSYKGKRPVIPFEERAEIVRSCKYVDLVVPQNNMDKVSACRMLNASLLFVGEDWYGTEKWKNYEKELEKEGFKVIYLPRIQKRSSTELAQKCVEMALKKQALDIKE